MYKWEICKFTNSTYWNKKYWDSRKRMHFRDFDKLYICIYIYIIYITIYVYLSMCDRVVRIICETILTLSRLIGWKDQCIMKNKLFIFNELLIKKIWKWIYLFAS